MQGGSTQKIQSSINDDFGRLKVIELMYESKNFDSQLHLCSNPNYDATNDIILHTIRGMYQGISYRKMFIYKCLRLMNSLSVEDQTPAQVNISVNVSRDGDVYFSAPIRVLIQCTEVDIERMFNCRVVECNRNQSQSGHIIQVRAERENITIFATSPKFIERGQIIQCVVHEQINYCGLDQIAIKASIIQPALYKMYMQVKGVSQQDTAVITKYIDKLKQKYTQIQSHPQQTIESVMQNKITGIALKDWHMKNEKKIKIFDILQQDLQDKVIYIDQYAALLGQVVVIDSPTDIIYSGTNQEIANKIVNMFDVFLYFINDCIQYGQF